MAPRWIPRDAAVAIVDGVHDEDTRGYQLERLSSILQSGRTQNQLVRLAHICFLRDAADMLERIVPHLHPSRITPLCRIACFCGSVRCALLLMSTGADARTMDSFSCIEILASGRPLSLFYRHEDLQQLIMIMRLYDPDWIRNAHHAIQIIIKRSPMREEALIPFFSFLLSEIHETIKI